MTRHGANDARIRERRAVGLRLAGLTYDRIAEELGYVDRGAAHKAVSRVMQRETVQDITELRTEELAGIDEQMTQVSRIINDSNEPAMTRLKAHDMKMRLRERKARLMGLDKPIKIDANVRTINAKAEAMDIVGELLSKEADAFAAGVEAAQAEQAKPKKKAAAKKTKAKAAAK